MSTNNSVLHKPHVLVLNRAWQAVGVRTVADAIGQIMNGSMTPLDTETMTAVRSWKEWMALPVREHDDFIRSLHGPVRAPTVIISARYDKVPKKRPRFSSRAIRERDGFRCQYTGRRLKPDEGSLDHIIPVSRGGRNTFDNVVYADKAVNHKKADRTPEEAGLKLLCVPKTPQAVPVYMLIKNPGVKDWETFLA